MNRRASVDMMTDIFSILVFVLIVIVALVLLLIDAKKLQSEKPQLDEDLRAQKAATFLISLLRTPTPQGTFADLIIINDGRQDAEIVRTFVDLTKSTNKARLVIKYPDGRMLYAMSGISPEAQTANAPLIQPLPVKPTGGRDITGRAFGDYGEDLSSYTPQPSIAKAQLPSGSGNIQVELEMMS
jgi:hypothetical protein